MANSAVGDLFEIDATLWDGQPIRLDQYRGKVLLIVNVASQCGFTPQYAGLEALYRKYQDRGLAVLGFPCNQFGRQEPGTERDIHEFCTENYNVTFPLFSKVEVNGPGAHPLFAFLKSQKSGLLGTGAIKWNFTKFLIDRAGQVVYRFGPRSTPDAIEPHIVRLLT